MARYQVSPIADEHCDSIRDDIVIILTNSLDTAKWHAEHNSYVFGAGIFDHQTDQLDVGYGFGIPCPNFTDE